MNKSLLVIVKMILILFFIPFSAGAESREQTALDAIQKRYEEVKTFKAKFVQKSFVKMMNQSQEARGSVQIKKPGKMKWVYKAPDPQTLVSDQKILWLYAPEDRQVTKIPVKSIYSSNTPALFLAGKGKLTESFNVATVSVEDKITRVVLIPKQKDNNVDRLVLIADNKNYQIIGSTVYDKLGNKTEIRFTEIQVNLNIPDSVFQFHVPEGVELLDYTENR
ncbi:MAG: outer membrane lipoprotein chaperone LolA [Nitrospinaceae bacterium]